MHKVQIVEDALGYKIVDLQHGHTGLREIVQRVEAFVSKGQAVAGAGAPRLGARPM